ncbi:hypothetical protein RHS01_01258 [Rhizoctonia solani]|uniref:Uncharacterized protein n=1 Tax=Rhizoctonia solani TaxID=456999 RepID=A0A8H7IPC6_9AGAM|nr:hypothetical protein RHS01_01258 [Rhizoctonia solani]
MPRTSASADSSGKAKSIPVISRQVTRLYEMFWPVIDVINMGKETRPMSADEKKSFKATLPQDQKRGDACSSEHTAALTRDLKKLLGDGQSNGRSEDMGKVSREMPGWEAMAWDPPLGINPSVVCFISNAQSSLRQFNMTGSIQKFAMISETGCSQQPRYNFLDIYGCLTAISTPSKTIGWITPGRNSDMCRVLHNVFPHLCQNDECVHYSNQRGTWMLLQALEGGIIGLAKVYNLTKVTPAFIAYVAVVVHHALTTEAIFSEICGGFNYGVYYNQIRTFLEAPRFASRAKVLLDWWNKRLFGSYNMGMHTLNEGGVSTLDELDAEAEADPGLSGDERVGSSRQLDEDEEPEE